MIDKYEVLRCYKKAESKYKNKGYKEPKDIEKTWDKLSDEKKEIIQTLSNYFNTKWYNINPEMYFLSGFKKWKSFNWSMTLRKDLMKIYISSDKSKKRNDDNIQESIDYIKTNYISIKEYCKIKDGNRSKPVIDYMRSKISGLLLFYLIDKNYLRLTEDDNSYIMCLENERYKDLMRQIRMRDYKYGF